MARAPHDGSPEAHEQIRLVDSPDPETEMNDILEENGNSLETLQASRQININRPVINQCVLSNETHNRVKPWWEFLKKKRCSPLGCIFLLIPILHWLPRYNWREDITYDLTAGFTVAVMHIPQGMAYALLGNLPPIIGIYMAFFPVIIYSCMGTSRHVSMGTFAVICLMTGKVASERVNQYTQVNFNQTTNAANGTTIQAEGVPLYSTVEIAVALSMGIGLWQLAMGICRLGALSLLLSSEVVSGFTTGAAVHVLTSQFKNLLGLNLPRRNGLFKIVLTYKDLLTNLTTANPVALVISAITMICLVVYNEVLKPYVSAKISFPLPVELFTIIIGTLVSSYWNMKSTFNITIVEYIPTGLPPPSLPPIEILPDLLMDSLIISIVAYAISISMSKIFATKYNYPLDPNQELIAQGASNIFGSFFSCAPIAASLSRSLVQELVGGRTQLAGLFSCAIMVIVLLWIGPFFETLPNCVLSAIIVVALKGMFLQILDLPKVWKLSILNGMIWIITFLVTVIFDIEYGLAVGILLSINILIWRSNKPNIEVLGAFSGVDLFVSSSHVQSRQISGTKIIKYTGNLNFATIEHFVKKVERIVPYQKKVVQNGQSSRFSATTAKVVHIGPIEQANSTQLTMHANENVRWIILDFSSTSSTDPEALKSIHLLYKRYEKQDIQCLFSACPSSVLSVMESCKFISQIGKSKFFPSVLDAVVHSSSSVERNSQQNII